MKTKNKLAEALREAKAPPDMVANALSGKYDDYESESATPIRDLVRDAVKNGLTDIARRAKDGDFDGTREDFKTWLKTQRA